MSEFDFGARRASEFRQRSFWALFAEAKGTGFDTKAMRTIIRLRKKDQAERQEEETILDLYKAALGMV